MAFFKIFQRVKPIFVVRVTTSISNKEIDKMYSQLEKNFKGYYILVYKDPTIKSVKFECFNCEVNEKEFQELKDQVLKSLKNDSLK
jgi:hypothetical protein